MFSKLGKVRRVSVAVCIRRTFGQSLHNYSPYVPTFMLTRPTTRDSNIELSVKYLYHKDKRYLNVV